MDADDLVITLKKSLAKLSRTERRKAVELVGDVSSAPPCSTMRREMAMR